MIRKMETKYKKGDYVSVSPTANGLGVWIDGVVESVSPIMGRVIITVGYFTADQCGNRFITLSNDELLKPMQMEEIYE